MTTIRISEKSRTVLRELAKTSEQTMQTVLEQAIEEYRRKKFLQEASRAFAVLRNNSQAWKEEKEERQIWEVTLMDGEE